MRVDVAFTPSAAAGAPVGIVVDLMRATSTIAQALAAGYRRVLCCAEVEEALALRETLSEDVVLGGERKAVAIPGFELGNSPLEYREPRAETAILTTTNGTRALVRAGASCELLLAGALVNLDAVARAARERGEDVTIFCAGVEGRFAIDDAYCAGRIAAELGGERSDAAETAVRLAASFADGREAIETRNPWVEGVEADVEWCSQENLLDIVPVFTQMVGPAAEIVAR